MNANFSPLGTSIGPRMSSTPLSFSSFKVLSKSTTPIPIYTIDSLISSSLEVF